MTKMLSLSEAFIETQSRIDKLKSTGFQFEYKGIDVTDVLFGEFMFQVRNEANGKRSSILTKLKLIIKYFGERKKYHRSNKIYKHNGILFFATSLNHWKNTKSVINQFKEKGEQVFILTTKEKLAEIICSEGHEVKLIKGFAFTFSELFLNEINENQDIEFFESFTPQIRFLHRAIYKLIKSIKPKYILIGNDNTYEGRLVSLIARKENISTGSIQHGSLNRINPLHGRSRVNQFFVYGQQVADELQFLGKNVEEIVVAGWPQKEELAQRIDSSNSFNLLSSPFITIALSGPGHGSSIEHHIKQVSALIDMQKSLKLKYCIKLHPKDRYENYPGFNSSDTVIIGNVDLANANIDLFAVFKQSIVIITGASTAALDAILIGKPVITMDLMNEYSEVDFIKDGLTLHAKSPNELKTLIKNCLHEKEPSVDTKFIEKYFYKQFDKVFNPSVFIANDIIKYISLKTNVAKYL